MDDGPREAFPYPGYMLPRGEVASSIFSVNSVRTQHLSFSFLIPLLEKNPQASIPGFTSGFVATSSLQGLLQTVGVTAPSDSPSKLPSCPGN